MTTKWSSEMTVKFLKMYEDIPCLWDVSIEHYKNRQLRENGYRKLSVAMNIEGFDSAAVRAKIRSLRNAYALERAKITKSKKSAMVEDEIYKPKVPWFPIADRMLRGIVQTKKSNSMELDEDILKETQSTQAENNPCSESLKPPARRKRTLNSTFAKRPKMAQTVKTKQQSTTEQVLQKLHHYLANLEQPAEDDNEFDAFGKSIASQLKKLPEEVALEAMVHIQTYLVKKRLAVKKK